MKTKLLIAASFLFCLAGCDKYPSETVLRGMMKDCRFEYSSVRLNENDGQAPIEYNFDSDEANIEEKHSCLTRRLEAEEYDHPIGFGQFKANRLKYGGPDSTKNSTQTVRLKKPGINPEKVP